MGLKVYPFWTLHLQKIIWFFCPIRIQPGIETKRKEKKYTKDCRKKVYLQNFLAVVHQTELIGKVQPFAVKLKLHNLFLTTEDLYIYNVQ